MGLKDINLRRALKSFPYIVDGTPQQFQANGGVVHGKIKGIHGGLLPNDEPPHPQTHTALDDSVGAKGTPQYINVKGGPAELIPFPEKYDPNVGGIHGGTEGPVPAQPPHPKDHSTLDDAPLSGVNPQTFIYNGYTVLGVPTPIESKFIDGDNADWPSQDMMSGQIAGRTTSQPEGVGSLGNPQTFTITHAGGVATITGLQGEFDISELDLLAEKSLLMKTWKGSVELDLVNFPAPKFYNPDGWKSSETHGTNFTWPTYRGLGTSSPEKQGFRFGGGHAKQGFTVDLFGAKTIDGPLVEDVVDNYTRLVKQSGFWGNFISKQSDLQEDSIYPWDNFTSFDGILFEMGFEPGTRAVRIGNSFTPNTKPNYTKEVPQSNDKKYYGSFKAGDLDGDSDNPVDGFDWDDHPKMLYLYDSFILSGDDGSSYAQAAYKFKKDFGFKGMHFSADQLNTASTVANNAWNKMVNWAMQGYSNPIIPSINVVDSMGDRVLEAHTNNRYFSKLGIDEDKTESSKYVIGRASIVLAESNHLIGSGNDITKIHMDAVSIVTNSRLTFLYKTIILGAADSAAYTIEHKKFYDANKYDTPYSVPGLTVLEHPQGTSAQGRKYEDQQPYIEGREYIEKTVLSDTANPFMFYSKGESKGFHPKGEKVLTEKIQANFFKEGHDTLKNPTGLKDVPGAYPNLKQTMMMEQVKDTGKTKIIPQAVGGATLTLETDEDGRSEIVSKINQSPASSTTQNTQGLIHKYSVLAYPALNSTSSYSETLRSPGEMNEELAAEFGGKGGDRPEWLAALAGPEQEGARDIGKKKVYAIGRQGLMPTIAEDADKAVSVDGKALLTRGIDNKYIVGNDHVDKVNAIPYGSRVFGTGGPDVEDLDFIPLIFHDLWNKKDIVFRTMNLGSIVDTVTPEWTEQDFIGRSVAAATYSKTDRKFSFDFDVYPKTRQEFPILLEKINYLVGLCYPNLDKFMRQAGPLIKLTVGDILRSQMGYLTGCTVTFPDDSPWEIDKGLRFTKRINLSIDFTYIGGYIPIATGKHYGLSWLDGQSMAPTGVGDMSSRSYPARNKGTVNPDEDKNKIPELNKLFAELGQE
jgi:hypothetical protein